MKEYKLLKWYPSLVKEWQSNDFSIVVVEREDGYHLHPSLKKLTRLATVDKKEVEEHPNFWKKLIPKKASGGN